MKHFLLTSSLFLLSLFFVHSVSFAQTCPTVGLTKVEVCNDAGGAGLIRVVFNDGTGPFNNGAGQPYTYILFSQIGPTPVSDPLGPVPVTFIAPNIIEFSAVPDGTYFVRVIRDSNPASAPNPECSVTIGGGGITVNSANALDLISVIDPDCNPVSGSGDGSINITVSGGVAPYTYQWSSGQSTQDISSIDAGSYSVVVTDANNCTITRNFVVPVSTQAVAGPNQDVCTTTAAFAANAAGVSELGTWTLVSGSGTITDIHLPTSTVTNLGVGDNIFKWTISDSGGVCPGTTSDVTIKRFPPLTVEAGSANSICVGTPYTLVGSSVGGAASTGTWSIVNPATGGSLNNTTATANPAAVQFTATASGVYTLRLTTDNPTGPCDPISDDVIITVDAAAIANAGTNRTVCGGPSIALTGASVSGAATTGAWSFVSQPPGGNGVLSNTSQTATPATVTLSATAPGAYVLMLTTNDPAGPCGPTTAQVTLTVNAPVTVEAGNPNTICVGDSYTLVGASIGGGASTGTWSVFTGPAGATFSPNGATATPANVIFTPTNPGTYTLRLTTNNPAGPCNAAFDNVAITVTPGATVNAGPSKNACVGIALPLTGATVGGSASTAQWNILSQPPLGDGILSSTAFTNNPAAVTFTATTLGNYTLRLTSEDPTGPCIPVSSDVIISIVAPPDAGTDNGVPVCNNTSLNLFTSLGGTPHAGGLWLQSSGATTISITGNSGNFTGAAVGAYTFTYTVTGTAPCANDVSTLTVNVSDAPDAGTDNNVPVCNNNTALNLFTSLLGSPDSGGTWSQASGTTTITIAGNNGNFNGAAAGAYTFTYTIIGTAPCVNDVSTLTVNVVDAPDAGTDNSVPVCNNNTALNLFAGLLGSPDAGGTWSQASGTTTITIAGNNGNFNGAVAGAYTFTYTVTGIAPCANDVSTLTVNVSDAPDAGTDNSVPVCNNNTALNLFTSLLGSPDTGGTWSQASGATTITIAGSNANFNGAAAGAYTFTYTVTGTAPCANDVSTLTVNVVDAPDAGTDNSVPVCNNNTALNLFAGLLGSPDTGGTWSQASGTTTITIAGNNGNFNGAAAGAYTFTYTVTGTAPCANDVSTLTVNVSDAPDAGTDNSVPVCNNNTALNLFSGLLGSPDSGGTWSQASGTTTITITGNNGNFNGAAAGAYTFTYTVTGVAPCANDVSVLTVNVNNASDAGVDNTVPVCNSSNSYNLFSSLNGSPDLGGTWAQISGASTISITGNIANFLNANAGTYTFEYTVTACSNDVSTLTVNVSDAPDAGTDNSVPLCNNNTALNLFTSLLGSPDAGGTWSQTSGTTTITIAGNNGNFNGAAAGAYTFTYTVIGTAPCVNDVSTLTVNVVDAPDAGTDNSVPVCNNNTALNLFAGLLGSPDAGGTWSQASGTTTITIAGNNGNFNGAVAGAYTFTYTVAGTAPCANDVSTLTVNVSDAPDAGTDNSVPVCNNNTASNLFAGLLGTPDTGGTWSQISGTTTIGITGNNGDFTGAAAGAYTFTYTVTGTAPCANDVSTLTVNVTETADAGIDNTVSACNTDGTFNLFTSLLGTPDITGAWTQTSGASRTLTGNTVDLNGAAVGQYTFQYQVTGTAPCANDVAQVTVNVINGVPDAGTDNSVNACNSDASFNLFNSLGGTPDAGGVWADLDGSGATITGSTINLTTLSTNSFRYQYTLSVAGCGSSSAIVTVNVKEASDAGLDNAITECNDNNSLNLLTNLGGTPDIGGSWTQTTGTSSISISGNIADLTGAIGGLYTFIYSVTGAAPCANDAATLQVTINGIPIAGSNRTVTACNSDASFDLFASLGGTPDIGGAWTQTFGGSRTITGNLVNFNGAAIGQYRFQYQVNGTAPCPNDIAEVTVNVINGAPNAGADQSAPACNSNNAFNLFASLGGTPDSGGAWSDLDASGATISGNNVNLTTLAIGAYRFQYTITVAGCGTASAIVTVNVSDAPSAGTNNTVSSCNNITAFNLFSSLGGSPEAGGVWSQTGGSSRTITGNTVDLNGATSGAYLFEYRITAASPCTGAVAVLAVNVVSEPNAGTANLLAVCNNVTTVNLFSILGGTPDAGGSWTDLDASGGTIAGDVIDLTGVAANDYRFQYSVFNVACGARSSIATVRIQTPVTATLSGSQTICAGQSGNLRIDFVGAGSWTVVYSDGVTPTTVTLSTNPAFIAVSPLTTKTYSLVSANSALCGAGTISGTANVMVNPILGNQISAGSETWIGYVYDDNSITAPPFSNINFASARYRGFITETDIAGLGFSSYNTATDKFNFNLSNSVVLAGPNVCGSYLNNFSVRYKMDKSFTAGVYTFKVGSDDGVRLIIDGITVIDNFDNHAYEVDNTTLCLTAGIHQVVIEYFERGGFSRLSFDYDKAADPDVTTPVAVCVGSGSAPLLAVNTPDPSASGYNWYSNATATSLVGTGNSFTPVIGTGAGQLNLSVAGQTSYFVKAVYGSCMGEATEVVVDVVSSASIALNPPTVCATGGSVDLRDFVDENPVGGTFTFAGTSVTGFMFDPSTHAGTTVNITVDYSIGSCTAPQATLNVTVINNADFDVPATATPVCESGPDIDLTSLISNVTPVNGTFTFTGAVAGPDLTANLNGNSLDPSGLSGNIVIDATYAIGGCVHSEQLTVDVKSIATISTPTTAPSFCSSDADVELKLYVTAVPAGGDFTFSASDGITGVNNDFFDPSAGTQIITVNYILGGCAAPAVTFDINVTPSPDLTIDVDASPALICSNSTSAIEIEDAESNVTYQLVRISDNAIHGSVVGNGNDAIIVTPQLTVTTQYKVIAIPSSGQCSVEIDQVTVNVRVAGHPACNNPGGVGNINCTVFNAPITERRPTCAGQDDGEISIVVNGGTPSPNYVITLYDSVRQVPFTKSVTVAPNSVYKFDQLTASNHYFYVIEDGTNKCTLPYSLSLQTTVDATVVTSSMQDALCFGNQSGSAIINATGSQTGQYFYSIDGVLWKNFIPGNPGEINDLPANGTYNILVGESPGDACRATVQVTINSINQEIKLKSFEASDATCNGNDGAIRNLVPEGSGSTFEFSIDGGLTFQTEENFEGLSGGSYTLIVKDQSGCQQQISPAIAVKFPGFVNTLIGTTDADCTNEGRSGSIKISIADLGAFKVALSTDQFNEPDEDQYENYSDPFVTFSDLSRGTYYIYTKSSSAECPTRSEALVIQGIYSVDFDILQQCVGKDVSLSLIDITGDPSKNIEIKVFRKFTNIQEASIKIPFPATGSYLLDKAEQTFLQLPDEYSIQIVQEETSCTVKSPMKDYEVPVELNARVGQYKESYPDIATGAFTVDHLVGGITPYEIRIELDSASSLAIPSYATDFSEVSINNEQQFDMTYKNIPAGRYKVQIVDSLGCSIERIARVPMDEDIFIPNVMTPNDDGVNDVFFIRNLSASGNNKISVTNRWGKEVYGSNNYQNNWKGEGAADGIYYYRLQVQGSEPINGWIEIMRGSKP
jgi:gliding motility-associated-like protein